jgi:hypothetical protein
MRIAATIPVLLDGLEERDESNVVAVHADFQVAWSRSERAPAQRAGAELDAQARRRWHTLDWKVFAVG